MGRQEREQERNLLDELHDMLTPYGVTTVAMSDQKNRPCLEVLDRYGRARRVYVHVMFLWFYWGDRPDERASVFDVVNAAHRIASAARHGWNEGAQGDLDVDLRTIGSAYQA